MSMSVGQRLPFESVLEVSYVGTQGRHLPQTFSINAIQPGGLSTRYPDTAGARRVDGRSGQRGASVPGVRQPVLPAERRRVGLPLAAGDAEPPVRRLHLPGRLHALQERGHHGCGLRPHRPARSTRSQGTLAIDRTHYATFSWTWHLGDPAPEGGFKGALLNDWNFSGVSTYATGQPIRLGFRGDIGGDQAARAWWGTQDFANFDPTGGDNNPGDITPIFTCDPTISGASSVGDKILDVNCIGIPGFGETGPIFTPNNLRSPSRNFHDITVFKNFGLGGDRRLQFRVGAFNVFNQAYPLFRVNNTSDFDLTLDTVCNVRVSGVPNGQGGTADNVCDPRGGYHLTDNARANFGKIITKRGHRVLEFALRLFF